MIYSFENTSLLLDKGSKRPSKYDPISWSLILKDTSNSRYGPSVQIPTVNPGVSVFSNINKCNIINEIRVLA